MITFRENYYADVRIEDRSRTVIQYQDGKLQEFKTPVEVRAFLRVYDGKMWYYASVTDVAHIQKTLERLYAAATPNPAIEKDPVVSKLERNRDKKLVFADCSVRNIPVEQKQALLQSYLPLLSEDSACAMPVGIYLDRNSLYTFRSSLGADITYDYQTCGLSLRCSMAAFMRQSVPVVPGKYPVVLSPEAAGVFAHESFGHKSESDFMLSDESMRQEWQLGKQVGSSLLSIAECGEYPGSGYVPYDDEGTRARKNYLIKDGILAGRLHSAQTAAALGEEVTGNARAIDCTFEPIVRMTTTYIEPGKETFEQLLAPIEKGYYIKTISHGSGMSTFTIAPMLAYEIENGRLGKPTQISVITGSVFETLGLIDGLSDKLTLLSFVTGGCGKMEQMGLPVGFGGPCVRVSEMNVQ